MRILIVSDNFGLRGGAYVAMSRVAKLLISGGHDVGVFYSDNRHSEQVLDKSLLNKIILFPVKHSRSPWRLYIGDKRIAHRLSETIKTWQPDIVHIGNFHSVLSPEVVVVSDKHNMPTIFHICDHKLFCMNGYGFLEPFGQPCERCMGDHYRYGLWHRCGGPRGSWLAYVGRRKYCRFWTAIDAFAVPCDTTDKALDRFKIPTGRRVRMWYPVPEDEFSPSDTQDGTIVYYSSAYTKLKGLVMLIEACRHISSVHVEAYLMPGNLAVEQQREELETMAPSNIRIFSNISWQTGLNSIVASARAVVIPSLWSTVGEGALFQAMMMQKAIIASDRGAHTEILKHEENALLYDADDPSDLACCMDRISKDDELCRKLGRFARRWAMRNLGNQAYYQKLMALYEIAINERRKKSLLMNNHRQN